MIRGEEKADSIILDMFVCVCVCVPCYYFPGISLPA